MKWDAFFLGLLLVINIQVFPFDSLAIGGTLPNLLFCLLIFCTLQLPLYQAMGAAFCAGLALDLLAGYPFHINALLFMIIGLAIHLHRDMLFQTHALTQVVIAVLATLTYQSLYLFIINAWYLPDLPAMYLWRNVPGIALYTAAVTPLFYKLAMSYCRLWKISLYETPDLA